MISYTVFISFFFLLLIKVYFASVSISSPCDAEEGDLPRFCVDNGSFGHRNLILYASDWLGSLYGTLSQLVRSEERSAGRGVWVSKGVVGEVVAEKNLTCKKTREK